MVWTRGAVVYVLTRHQLGDDLASALQRLYVFDKGIAYARALLKVSCRFFQFVMCCSHQWLQDVVLDIVSSNEDLSKERTDAEEVCVQG